MLSTRSRPGTLATESVTKNGIWRSPGRLLPLRERRPRTTRQCCPGGRESASGDQLARRPARPSATVPRWPWTTMPPCAASASSALGASTTTVARGNRTSLGTTLTLKPVAVAMVHLLLKKTWAATAGEPQMRRQSRLAHCADEENANRAHARATRHGYGP